MQAQDVRLILPRMRGLDVAESRGQKARICLHFATCPSHPCIRQRRRRSRDREGDLQFLLLRPAHFGPGMGFLIPPSPVLAAWTKGNRSSWRRRASSCDSFRKRGCRDFGLKDVGARTPTIQSPAATYADIGPSRCRSAQVQAQNANPSPSAGPKELTETTPPPTRNQSAA
jgi:hypothetical protein